MPLGAHSPSSGLSECCLKERQLSPPRSLLPSVRMTVLSILLDTSFFLNKNELILHILYDNGTDIFSLHFTKEESGMKHGSCLRAALPVLFCFVFFFLCLFCYFFGPLLWHMEVPRLGVESEL